MQIELYQIAVTLIASFMIYQGISRYFSGQSGQTFLKLALRLIVWCSMIAIAIFPKITTIFADFIGLEGNINAVILTGFLLIFLIIFKILSTIERLEQQLSELTRTEALSKLKKDAKSKK